VLRQVIRPRSASGGQLARGTRFALSAWLGGTGSSRASVTVQFRSAAGLAIGTASIGPVGLVGSLGHRRLARRAKSGPVPPAAVSAQVDLRPGTSLPGADGGNSPFVGYDKAVAGPNPACWPICTQKRIRATLTIWPWPAAAHLACRQPIRSR
jgi:hypothetical protein